MSNSSTKVSPSAPVVMLARVWSATRIECPDCFVSCSIRAAVFTVSPINV